MTNTFLPFNVIVDQLIKVWRRLNGDTAYQSYLVHWQSQHAETGNPPLNRKAYFAAETKRKWNGIKRCC